MAVGDLAADAGYEVVPDTGETGRVRWGAREINRTRDYVAQLAQLLPANKAAFQAAAGIRMGNGAPPAALGSPGDLYVQLS